ncbi:hypothetical protein [Plantibacter sp. RU18]|uniref:hypothetical protein n=1 Tax=Plantibacter sp. RU18 TaxID=3158143 RepID=UPI003D36B74C
MAELTAWTPAHAQGAPAAGSGSARAPEREVPEDGPKSWSLPVPEGIYDTIGIWRGSSHWFDTVMDLVASPAREALRDQYSMADATLLRIADEYRNYADWATGHNVHVAHGTIAKTLGICARTVQRATRILEALGLATTLTFGRSILSADEKAEAFQTHGHRQTRAASVVALTLPPVEDIPSRDTNVHLPTYPPADETSHDSLEQQRRASAHTEAAAQLGRRQRQRPPAAAQPSAPEVRPLAIHRYLAELDFHFGHRLGQDQHIGHLERVLRRAGVDLQLWTVQDLATAVENKFPSAHDRLHSAKEPLRYFAWMLGRTVAPGDRPVRVELGAQARRRAVEREQFQRENERVRARLAADDPTEFERITEAMRAEQAEEYQHQTLSRWKDDRMQTDSAAITQNLLGPGKRPKDFDADVRELHDRVLSIHRYLTDRGWSLNRDEIRDCVEWNWNPSRLSTVPEEAWEATSISFESPQTLDVERILTVGLAGTPWNDTEGPINDAEIHERIETIESYRGDPR